VLTDRRKHGGSAVDQRTSRESALCFAENLTRFSLIFSAKVVNNREKAGKRGWVELAWEEVNKTRGGNHQLVAAAVSCLTLNENVEPIG